MTPPGIQMRRRSEGGFTLAALLVILTLMAMVIAYTVPVMWSSVMKRERDVQTIWVMKQYARAIQEFQRKRGALPTTLDQLKEQNKPRVLRALWTDPLTGKMDWILVSPAEVQNTGQLAPGMAPGSRPPQRQAQRQSSQGQQVGPFVGVRPPITGESFLSLNGQDHYEQWQYTTMDLQKEQNPTLLQGQPAPGGTGTPVNPRP